MKIRIVPILLLLGLLTFGLTQSIAGQVINGQPEPAASFIVQSNVSDQANRPGPTPTVSQQPAVTPTVTASSAQKTPDPTTSQPTPGTAVPSTTVAVTSATGPAIFSAPV